MKRAQREQEAPEQKEERLIKDKLWNRAQRKQEAPDQTKQRREKNKLLKRSKKLKLPEIIHSVFEDLDNIEEPSILTHDQKRAIHSNLEGCFTLDTLIQKVC